MDNEFIIKTDQISLKYLLDQKNNTALQQKGLNNFFCLNYKIEYKKGIENKVVDALSSYEGHSDNLLSLTVELTIFF
jgi:hypothetical protein